MTMGMRRARLGIGNPLQGRDGAYSAGLQAKLQALPQSVMGVSSNRFARIWRQSQNPLGFNKARAPVAAAQAIHPYTTAAAARGMDELIITYIDARVVNPAATTVIKKDDIARLQITARNQRRVDIDHFPG